MLYGNANIAIYVKQEDSIMTKEELIVYKSEIKQIGL